jgi:hypothetical protein
MKQEQVVELLPLSKILHIVADRMYEQCRHTFKNNNEYCALGAILDYYDKDFEGDSWVSSEMKAWKHIHNLYPHLTAKSIILPTLQTVGVIEGVTMLNDDYNMSFHTIADYLDKQGF